MFLTLCELLLMLQVKNYYKFKIEDKNKRFYENLKPSTEAIIFNHDIMTVLPNRDQHGRRMLLVETGSKFGLF